MKTALNKFIQRKFNAEACLENLNSGRQRITAQFSISVTGRVEKIRVGAQSSCLQDAAFRALNSLPTFEPGRQRGHAVEVLYSLPIAFNVEDGQSTKVLEQAIFDGDRTTIANASEQFDTIVNYARTPVEKLKELLHDNDIVITDAMLQEYEKYKKKKLIRNTTLNDTAAVILRKQLFEIPDTYFKRLDTDSVSRGGHAIRIPWGPDQIPDAEIIRVVPITKNTNMSEYAFSTMDMGWLNLDRFLNNNLPLKKFKVKIKNGQGASVKLVFKNRRALLNSKETEKSVFSFGDVPEGEEVKIIAIQKSQDGLYMGSTQVKVEDLETLDLSFKKYKLKQLKSELRRASNAFEE